MKRYNKGNIIKEILGQVFFDKGFSYTTKPNMWMFERDIQNKAGEAIHQQIYVQKSNMFKGLYFRLQTNAYGQLMVEAQELAQDMCMAYAYQTEEDFTELIKYFAKLMETKGFDVLAKISEPDVEERPTVSQQKYLYENHEALVEEFLKENTIGLDCDEPELLEFVYNFMNATKDKPIDEVSESLIRLAAFHGERFIKLYTGRWMYTENIGAEIEYIKVGQTGATYPFPIAVLTRIFLCRQRCKEFGEKEYKELLPSLLVLINR